MTDENNDSGHILTPDIVVNYTKNDKDDCLHFLTHVDFDAGKLSDCISPTAKKIFTSNFNIWFLKKKFELPKGLVTIGFNVNISYYATFNGKRIQFAFLESKYSAGSVSLLLHGDFGSYLYTGPFCYYKSFLNSPPIKPLTTIKALHRLYYDATFSESSFQFPSFDDNIMKIVKLIRGFSRKRPIFIMASNLTLYPIIVEIALQLKEKICVEPSELEVFRKMNYGLYFVDDPSITRIKLKNHFDENAFRNNENAVMIILNWYSNYIDPPNQGASNVFNFYAHSAACNIKDLIAALYPVSVITIFPKSYNKNYICTPKSTTLFHGKNQAFMIIQKGGGNILGKRRRQEEDNGNARGKSFNKRLVMVTTNAGISSGPIPLPGLPDHYQPQENAKDDISSAEVEENMIKNVLDSIIVQVVDFEKTCKSPARHDDGAIIKELLNSIIDKVEGLVATYKTSHISQAPQNIENKKDPFKELSERESKNVLNSSTSSNKPAAPEEIMENRNILKKAESPIKVQKQIKDYFSPLKLPNNHHPSKILDNNFSAVVDLENSNAKSHISQAAGSLDHKTVMFKETQTEEKVENITTITSNKSSKPKATRKDKKSVRREPEVINSEKFQRDVHIEVEDGFDPLRRQPNDCKCKTVNDVSCRCLMKRERLAHVLKPYISETEEVEKTRTASNKSVSPESHMKDRKHSIREQKLMNKEKSQVEVHNQIKDGLVPLPNNYRPSETSNDGYSSTSTGVVKKTKGNLPKELRRIKIKFTNKTSAPDKPSLPELLAKDKKVLRSEAKFMSEEKPHTDVYKQIKKSFVPGGLPKNIIPDKSQKNSFYIGFYGFTERGRRIYSLRKRLEQLKKITEQ